MFYFSVVVISVSTFGLQYVALQSIRDGNNHDDNEYNSNRKYDVPPPKSNVRRRVERRHPRNIHLVDSSRVNHYGWKLSAFTSTTSADQQSSNDDEDEDESEEPDDLTQIGGGDKTNCDCNGIHELDLLGNEVVAVGGWRVAWRMKTYDDSIFV